MAHRRTAVGPEHLLLGILDVEGNVGCTALENCGIDLRTLRDKVNALSGMGDKAPKGHIPFTSPAKNAIALSYQEAQTLGHDFIGPEHVLLGLLREGEERGKGVVPQALGLFRVRLIHVRQQVGHIVTLRAGYLDRVRRELRGEAPGGGQAGAARPAATAPRAPAAGRTGSAVSRWAQAHVLSAARPEATDPGNRLTDLELRAAVTGLPLLARAGIVVPLALLLDLILLTGGHVPADIRLRALAGQPGMARLRALAWPPGARVALAGLLACDLPRAADFTVPDAPLLELRSALTVALGGTDAASAHGSSAGGLSLPVGETPGWQATAEVFDALLAATAQVSELTIAMLEILGSVAAAAEPTLPVRIRHRIASLPRIGTRERRLIMETVTMSTRRSEVTGMVYDLAAGSTGVSRRGRITGLVPTQLALPEELIAYRHASQELLYRVSEAETESPPETVTLVLDTTPATYGSPEVVLRLVVHVIAVTLWTVRKAPALVSLDQPGLSRQLGAPSDLVAVWTARTLEPPDIAAALSTARRANAPAIVLTEHHALRDQGIVPHRGLRVLTTHVADDSPAAAPHSPFHVHLPPDPAPAQVIRAVRDLLEPNAGRRVS